MKRHRTLSKLKSLNFADLSVLDGFLTSVKLYRTAAETKKLVKAKTLNTLPLLEEMLRSRYLSSSPRANVREGRREEGKWTSKGGFLFGREASGGNQLFPLPFVRQVAREGQQC